MVSKRRKPEQNYGDFPPGSPEPDPHVRTIRNLKTGGLLRRSGPAWIDKDGFTHGWYRINHWDPLYPGYVDVTDIDEDIPTATEEKVGQV